MYCLVCAAGRRKAEAYAGGRVAVVGKLVSVKGERAAVYCARTSLGSGARAVASLLRHPTCLHAARTRIIRTALPDVSDYRLGRADSRLRLGVNEIIHRHHIYAGARVIV